MKIIMNEVQKHKNSLIVGEPQLNECDDAVMVSSEKNLQKLKLSISLIYCKI